MSVEFNLEGVDLDLEGAKSLLSDWQRRQPIELYQGPDLSGEESTGYYAHIWGPGSIRGVLVSFQPLQRALTIRFNAFASRQDWRNGFSLLRRALVVGGGQLTRAGGRNYVAEQLTDERAEREAVEDFCKSSQMLFERQHHEVHIPLGCFSLKLRPQDVPQCSPTQVPAVESLMSRRVERYATADRVGTWRDESGAACGRWDRTPCLVPAVDVVQIEADGSFKLPFQRLKAVLGERAENCGELTYLPALPRRDPLWGKLLKEANVVGG